MRMLSILTALSLMLLTTFRQVGSPSPTHFSDEAYKEAVANQCWEVSEQVCGVTCDA
jgi:hypothetical protein